MSKVVCIGICMLFAFAGSLFTPEPGSWYYTTLARPSWNPPDWLFPPVWTVLFIMMGVSLSLVLEEGLEKVQVRKAALLFGLQLLLNLGWSASFFGLRSPLAGLVEIVLLWFAILATITVFNRISRTASLLLVPYLLWVSFATFLNLTIVQLNR